MYLEVTPNNSFKPNLLRYTNNVAGKACHVVGYATQVGLTQALGGIPKNYDDSSIKDHPGGYHCDRVFRL